jgi:hypothetical protein
MHAGEMIIVAARPSMGKTSFAMNIVENVAVDQNRPCAVFSLEMTADSLVQRLICSRAKINMRSLMSGQFLNQGSFQMMTRAASALAGSKIFIDDTPALSILDLRSKARRLHKMHKIELIMVDYLQLCRSTSRRAQDNRQQEIAEISSGLKALAKELSLPIIVLAQLNRGAENRTSNKPKLSDLRESGSIEQDADVVGLLFRQEYYAEDDDARAESAGEAEFLIAKQRNGPTGGVPLTFRKEFMRFEDREKQHKGLYGVAFARLVLGAPGARVSAVDLGPCARAAAREDGGVVIVRADTCERVPTLLRAEETSCTGTACACGEACTGGADEALLDVRPLGLPSDRLLDWELEAQGSVRVVAMLVGDTSASSPGTDVLVAAWNAADGASAPRRVEPVLISSGRLPTVRGLGRSLELVTRRTAGALDVVVGVEVEAGGVDVLAVGGVTFCAR